MAAILVKSGDPMVGKQTRAYMRFTKEALTLLGQMIKLERKARKMSEVDFADRSGISRATLQKIEKGDPTVEIGIVFEAAHIAGIKLFEVENNFTALIENTNNKIALLPKRIRKSERGAQDDF